MSVLLCSVHHVTSIYVVLYLCASSCTLHSHHGSVLRSLGNHFCYYTSRHSIVSLLALLFYYFILLFFPVTTTTSFALFDFITFLHYSLKEKKLKNFEVVITSFWLIAPFQSIVKEKLGHYCYGSQR